MEETQQCNEQREGKSVREVDVQREYGSTMTHSTETEVREGIWNKNHRKRSHVAERAPICQGKLRQVCGYTALSPVSDAVLQGNYK